jgi:hypothetical protein
MFGFGIDVLATSDNEKEIWGYSAMNRIVFEALCELSHIQR